MRIKLYYLTFLSFCFFSRLEAQQFVDLPEYGVSFEIPIGWTGSVQEDFILLGHASIPGMMFILENTSSSPEELKQEAMSGIYEEGVSLKPEGDFLITKNRVEGYYKGSFNGTGVKAYAVGLISRLSSGLTAIVLTESAVFSDEHVVEMNKLIESVRFKEVTGKYTTDQWRGWLVGSQLRYLYSSGGSDYGGGYSGTSTDISINLCSDGSFLYSNSSQSSFDGSGGFGYTSGRGNGSGTYSIEKRGSDTYLKLNFNSGEISEYEVTSNDKDHTLLNGTRYFLVDVEGCR